MTWVINMISGPGSGKSTLAAELFVYMKKRNYKVEYLQEYAKKLVWTKQFHMLDNQHIVSYKYFTEIKSMYDCDEVDFVILDSSLLNGIYYNRYNPNNLSNVEKTEAMIIKYYNNFQNFNVFVNRGDDYKYENAGRIQNEEESIVIDKYLKNTLEKIDIKLNFIKINIKTNEAVENLYKLIKNLKI